MAPRRALSNLNLQRTPRFLVSLKAEHKGDKIKVESNTGYDAEIMVDDKMNFDNAIAAINDAMQDMRLEPVDHSVLFRILCEYLGVPIPKLISAEAIEFACNTLERNEDIKLNYPKLKQDWTEAFEEEAQNSKINEGKSLGMKLGVKGSAFSLLAEKVNAFGGFSQNYTQWDALSILEKCAKKDGGEWIRAAEFCDAMRKSIIRVTKPPRMVAFRRSFSRDRLDRLLRP